MWCSMWWCDWCGALCGGVTVCGARCGGVTVCGALCGGVTGVEV